MEKASWAGDGEGLGGRHAGDMGGRSPGPSFRQWHATHTETEGAAAFCDSTDALPDHCFVREVARDSILCSPLL